MRQIAKFSNGEQTLTVSAISGKSGINVKVTVKAGSGEGAAKAQTGCR